MEVLLLGKNLRFLREKESLNLDEIQYRTGFKRTTWNGYENGKSFPSLSDFLKICEIFGVSETELLHADLSKTHLIAQEPLPKKRQHTHLNTHPFTHLNDKYAPDSENISGNKTLLNEPLSTYKTSRMPAVITVSGTGHENILFVPVKAQAGYLIGHGDPSFLEQQPAFSMPGLHNGTYRMFEVAGTSMSPTLSHADKVIAQWVPSIGEIRENRIHVMVLRDGILIKRVLNRVTERGVLYLKSDTLTHRLDHPIREITPSDILEIWYVRMKVSGDLSEPSELYTRMSELEINMHEIMKKIGLKKP